MVVKGWSGPPRAWTYSLVERRATWPRRRAVSIGSLTRIAAEEAKNLVTEKVMGETWLSIMNRVRRTRGVERVRTGWISELRTVGTASIEEQRYEGMARRVASVRRGPFPLGVTISLLSMLARMSGHRSLWSLPGADQVQRRQSDAGGNRSGSGHKE